MALLRLCPSRGRLLLFAAALLLVNCAVFSPWASPTPTASSTLTPTIPASATPLPPRPTQNPTATTPPPPSPTPTALFLALPGTPIPSNLAVLSAENALQVSGLAGWQDEASTDLAWSPDGGMLAVANFADINIYNALERTLEQTVDAPDGVVTIAYSPAGNFLASGQRYGDEPTGYSGDVDFWRIPGWERLDILYTSSRSVTKVSFSPNGRIFAAALGAQQANTHQVVLWDTTTWEITRTVSAGVVLDIAFAPDGKTFATTPDQYAVKIWQIKDGQTLHYLRNSFTGAVNCLAYAPDGQTLATGHYDGTIRIWDVGKGSLLHIIETGATVLSLAYSPGGSLLASGHGYDDTLVRLYDVANLVLLNALPGHSGAVDSLAFSPDGRMLASASYDGSLRLWGVRP